MLREDILRLLTGRSGRTRATRAWPPMPPPRAALLGLRRARVAKRMAMTMLCTAFYATTGNEGHATSLRHASP